MRYNCVYDSAFIYVATIYSSIRALDDALSKRTHSTFMHTKYIYRDDFDLHIGIKENDDATFIIDATMCVRSFECAFTIDTEFSVLQLSQLHFRQFQQQQKMTATSLQDNSLPSKQILCHWTFFTKKKNSWRIYATHYNRTLNVYCVKNQINKEFNRMNLNIKEWKLLPNLHTQSPENALVFKVEDRATIASRIVAIAYN